LLRLPFLATQSLWFDETYTAHVVGGSLGEMWDRVGATESTPPLFYALTWVGVHASGSEGEAALRAVSALALVAAVPVAYWALRRFVGAPPAMASAALVACSPLLTWYALDARAYGLLVLTGLVSVWACAAALERATPRRLGLWALACACAVWTHWFAGFLVLGEVVVLMWLAPGARRGVALAAGTVLLALLPLVGVLRDQTGDDRAGFIADASLADRLEQLVRQFGAGPNVPHVALEAALLGLTLGAFALQASRVAALSRPQGRTLARALWTIVAVGLLVPLALAASGIYDRFNVRNVIYVWPLLTALAAPALLRARGLPLAALLALGVASGLWTTTGWRYGNPDWRAAIERIEAIAPGRPVLAATPLGAPVAERYLGRRLAAAPSADGPAWLVVEPQRTDGRALEPTEAPTVPGFTTSRELTLHGFRLIELTPAGSG
jgi:uncharacterized membrane protein